MEAEAKAGVESRSAFYAGFLIWKIQVNTAKNKYNDKGGLNLLPIMYYTIDKCKIVLR